MRENELESEADLNIKVETDKQENEPETDENVFATPSRVRQRSGSLENIRPSVLATPDNTPSPNSRQKDRGTKISIRYQPNLISSKKPFLWVKICPPPLNLMWGHLHFV